MFVIVIKKERKKHQEVTKSPSDNSRTLARFIHIIKLFNPEIALQFNDLPG